MSIVCEATADTVTLVDQPSSRPDAVNRSVLTFASETELAAPVRAWLEGCTDVVAVAEEVDAGYGIADLVAGRCSLSVLPARPVFASSTATQLMELLQHPVCEATLRTWAPAGWRSLQTRIVQPLVDAGLIHVRDHAHDSSQRWFEAALDVTDPFESLIAVELKLRDWRKAIAQAGRYRLFAEVSYVALPAHRVTNAVRVEAARNKVGVLAVAADGRVMEVVAPVTAPPMQPHRRRWAAEQTLDAVRTPSTRAAGSPIC